MGMLGQHKGVSTGPGLTKQSFAGEVDINKIIAGYEKTGMVTHLNSKEPFYGDVSEIGDYEHCLEVVKEAEELFGAMEAKVREKFKNDPAEMIDFLEDPSNIEEAVKLGMVVEREKPPIVTTPGDTTIPLERAETALPEPKSVVRTSSVPKKP